MERERKRGRENVCEGEKKRERKRVRESVCGEGEQERVRQIERVWRRKRGRKMILVQGILC